jgi:solute carrier family 35 (UDP-sugar transporter), member A1/2/3
LKQESTRRAVDGKKSIIMLTLSEAFSAKGLSLLAFVLQNVGLVMMIRYTKTQRQGLDPYLSSVVVLSAEWMKIVINVSLEVILRIRASSASEAADGGAAAAASDAPGEESATKEEEYAGSKRSRRFIIMDIWSEMTGDPGAWKLSVPAILYLFRNNLSFLALENLSIPVFQVLEQGKLLTTAVFNRVLLQKEISCVQYIALTLLAAGVALVHLSSMKEGTSDAVVDKEQNHVLGLIAVLSSCVFSGLAGVYFEVR